MGWECMKQQPASVSAVEEAPAAVVEAACSGYDRQ